MNTGRRTMMTFKDSIDKEELAEYPVEGFQGEVIIIDNYNGLEKSIQMLKSATVLGFDTETKPSFRKGKKNKVALLQLADERRAFLFRINRIGLPSQLVDILSDASVTKVGVAIHDDIKGLNAVSKLNHAGFVELQDYVKEFGIINSGLRKLTAIVLGFRISKRQQVTNWEAEDLTEAQVQYAATDAWVCYEIYMKLNKNHPG